MLFGYDEMISLKILNLNFLFHTLSIFFQFGGNENPSISFPSLSLLLIQTREEFPFPVFPHPLSLPLLFPLTKHIVYLICGW